VNNPESIIVALVFNAALVNPANSLTLYFINFLLYFFVVLAPIRTIVGVGS